MEHDQAVRMIRTSHWCTHTAVCEIPTLPPQHFLISCNHSCHKSRTSSSTSKGCGPAAGHRPRGEHGTRARGSPLELIAAAAV
eukprot:6185579-Pleurochrysis_carterae.AAC.2